MLMTLLSKFVKSYSSAKRERVGGGVIRCLFICSFHDSICYFPVVKKRGFLLSSEIYSLCYIVTLTDREPTDEKAKIFYL